MSAAGTAGGGQLFIVATNWTIPTSAMIPQVLGLSVMAEANENIDANSVTNAEQAVPNSPVQSFDPQLDDRATQLIALVVAQIRESIQVAGRFPLSVTSSAVPPKAVRHVLNIVAYQLINSMPNLKMVIMTDKGAYAPFKVFYDEGLKYMKYLEDGGGILPPEDPTGIDYVNPVDPNTNPAVCAVTSVPINREIDLSTDGSESGNTYTGTQSPNNLQWGITGDIYEQTNAAGQMVKIWEKTTPYGTTGWV